MNPKVSVILPVYNVEPYLRQCLDSICEQTLKEIEIICIDDCSTDCSKDILREYKKIDCRVILVENDQNIGVAECRNLGIRMAKGEYLSILDSDDFFEQDMLASVYAKCKKTQADIGAYDFYEYDNGTGIEKRTQQPICSIDELKGEISHDYIDMHTMSNYVFSIFNCGGAWQKLYKRSFIVEHNILFQNLPRANDVYFSCMTMALSKIVCYLPHPFVHYRINRAGQLTRKIDKYPLSLCKAFEKVYTSLVNRKIFNKCAVSYNSLVTFSVLGEILDRMGLTAKNKAYSYLRWHGIDRLGLSKNLDRNFVIPRCFITCKMIRENASLEEFVLSYNDFEHNFLVSMVYDFIIYLKKTGDVCALWGYGKLGKLFFQIAQSNEYEFLEIIDQDTNLQGQTVGEMHIVSAYEVDKKIQAVVITNSMFRDEIRSVLDQGMPNVKIFDFGYYKDKECKFEQCVF